MFWQNITITLKFFLGVSSLCFILFSPFLINQANANMFNKFKKGFYFEKYDTAEEAKEALLELHPVGSDVEGLVKTLEKAGSLNRTIKSKSLILNKKEIKNKYLIWYWYSHKNSLSLFSRKWDIFIENDSTKIINIFVSYQQGT